MKSSRFTAAITAAILIIFTTACAPQNNGTAEVLATTPNVTQTEPSSPETDTTAGTTGDTTAGTDGDTTDEEAGAEIETRVVSTLPETTATSADPKETIEITSPAFEVLPDAKVDDIKEGAYGDETETLTLQYDGKGGITLLTNGGASTLRGRFVPNGTRFSVVIDNNNAGDAQIIDGILQVSLNGTGVCDGFYNFDL